MNDWIKQTISPLLLTATMVGLPGGAAAQGPGPAGEVDGATHAHEDKHPLCGDIIRITLKLDADGRVADCAFDGDGCVISQASASMLLEELHGKTVEEVKAFGAEDMLKLYGPRRTPNRQKCCLLSWRVIQQAVFSPV